MRTILIVDDDPVSIATVALIIRAGGYTSASASSAAEAIAWLQTADSVEMVITDQCMPEMTGLELYSAVHSDSRFRNLPFILCTGFADEATVKEAMRLGIRHFIVKPITPKVVLEKISIVDADYARAVEAQVSASPAAQMGDPGPRLMKSETKAGLPVLTPTLTVPIDDARTCIAEQISSGAALLDLPILSFADLTKARVARREWSHRNQDILSRIFDNRSAATMYGETMLDMVSLRTDMLGKIGEYHNDMRRSIDKLQSIAGILNRLSAESGLQSA